MKREIERRVVDNTIQEDKMKIMVKSLDDDNYETLFTFYGINNRKIRVLAVSMSSAQELVESFDPSAWYDYYDFTQYNVEIVVKSKALEILNIGKDWVWYPFFVSDKNYDKLKIWIIKDYEKEKRDNDERMKSEGFKPLTKNIMSKITSTKMFTLDEIQTILNKNVLMNYQVSGEIEKIITNFGKIRAYEIDVTKDLDDSLADLVFQSDIDRFKKTLQDAENGHLAIKIWIYMYENEIDEYKLWSFMFSHNLEHGGYSDFYFWHQDNPTDDIINIDFNSKKNYMWLKQIMQDSKVSFDDLPVMIMKNQAFPINIPNI